MVESKEVHVANVVILNEGRTCLIGWCTLRNTLTGDRALLKVPGRGTEEP